MRSILLSAPLCTSSQLLHYKVGLRPGHNNGPQLHYEIIHDNSMPYIIAHNYGHGSLGWTFAPGSAQISYDNIIQACNKLTLDPYKSSIAVLGGGINGLMSAHFLAKKGFKVTVYAQEFSPYTTSDLAPAIFTPPSNTKIFDEIFLKKLLCTSYNAYKELAESSRAEFKGVTYQDLYTHNDDAGMEIAVQYGLIPPGELVDVYFSPTSSPKRCTQYRTFLMDTDIIMEDLMKKLQELGVPFIKKRLKDKYQCTSLGHHIIVNCLGLGAQTVVQDSQIIPIQGHIVRLQAQPHVNYMFFSKNDDGSFVHWISKKNYVFVGGTYIPNTYSTIVDETVCTEILSRLQNIIQ